MLPEFPFYIDSTMLSVAKQCEVKFLNQFIHRLVPAKSSIHLHAGRAFAAGCEKTRLAYFAEGKDWDEAIILGQIALFYEWNQGLTEEIDTAGSGKTLPNMLILLEEYFRYWDVQGKTDFIPYIRDNGHPAVEFSFSIPLEGTAHPVTGDPILYVGRLDMLAHRKNSSILWATDEKTTKALGPKWGQLWELRGQFIGYTWACRTFGYNVAGALVRGVKLTDSGNMGFVEVPIPVNDFIIERWLKETVKKVNYLIERYKDEEFAYDFADGCSAYGGCPYLITCNSKHPYHWLKTNFVENEWNPIFEDGHKTIQDLIETTSKPQEIIT